MSATQQPVKKNNRSKPGQRLLAIIVILIIANIVAWFFYGQADLTKDSRYTITPATTQMLKKLDAQTEVLIFLTGDDLPAAFKSLSNSTQSVLRNFRDISNNKVTYRVIDPLGKDTSAIQILKQYRMSGIPVNITAGKKGMTQKMIFPWALVTTVTKDGQSLAYPVFLQEANTPNLGRKTLLKSEMLLEYNLANGIHQLIKKEKPAVAYITGQGEPMAEYNAALFYTLAGYYTLDTFNLPGNTVIPTSYKAIIINGPMLPFSEEDKFKLDQYLMNGGQIFWSLNMVTGNLDSLKAGRFNAMPVELNLNDLLFHYGVRINTNLIEDAVNFAEIPLQAKGNNSEPTFFPWVYFPELQAGSEHPIVKNMNGVLSRFASSIDTNSNDASIKKTILLSSSKYSKTEAAPLPVILESAMVLPNPAAFPQHNLIGAVLLEGAFTSAYATRKPVVVAKMIDSLQLPFAEKMKQPGKMIVTGDADLLSNEFSQKDGPMEMGIFRYMQGKRFDNQNFLLNCMEYMTDADNLLEARSKSFEPRVLDPKVVERERSKWQFINIGVPVISILILGGIFFFVRKRKYA